MKLIGSSHRIVSVIGMSKNSGKTVTLGYLIEEAFESGRILGLTSIGRDGETTDIVTASDKPRIYVYSGTLIATAEMLFSLCEAKLEVLEVTRFFTPMGRVVIARALEDGYVQIGGASANNDIRQLADRMLDFGADLVFVDGALDRSSSASPVISDSCVLATGAAVDRYMQNTVQKTAHLAELFKIGRLKLAAPDSAAPHADECFKKVTSTDEVEELFESSTPAFIDRYGCVREQDDIKTAIGAGRELAARVGEDTRYIVIKGALINRTIRDFIESTEHYRNIEWVVRDATRLFVDPLEWKYLLRAGVTVSVVNEVRLLAVTANPTSPYSYSYNADAFLDELRDRISDVPVINVMALEEEW